MKGVLAGSFLPDSPQVPLPPGCTWADKPEGLGKISKPTDPKLPPLWKGEESRYALTEEEQYEFDGGVELIHGLVEAGQDAKKEVKRVED